MHTKLYLISPPKIALKSFAKQLEEALADGDIVGAFQLRLKDASDAEIIEACAALQPICEAREVAFILNDRPDLVVETNADGVHIGQEDLEMWPLNKVRRMISTDHIIGITCHASRHLAMEAGEHGADYVAFGAFYPTTSKPKEKLEKWGTPEPEILAWWHENTILPCVAIGGITPSNCDPLVKAGADFIAALSYVWDHPKSPKEAVREFASKIDGRNS